MNSLLLRTCAASLAAALFTATQAFAAAPVFDPIPVLDTDDPTAPPKVPVGKTLVIPISLQEPDGEVLSFSVKTSHKKLFARVRTGNPILKVHVSYPGVTVEGEEEEDEDVVVPPIEGDMEFQLFRDVTPITANFIAGFAQAGFYNNLIMHRVVKDFVVQGGDPLGTGAGNVGFTFDHEFRPELIFSGRGQLAMANSNGGYNRGTSFGSGFIQLGNFKATNGSQFFVTIKQPRHLDFRHTIFGQLIRGFEVLDALNEIPVNASARPTAEVKMTSVTVLPGKTQATLLVAAGAAVGNATVTVTAKDEEGNTVTQTIPIQTVADTTNDPPIHEPLGSYALPLGTGIPLPLRGYDLERDFIVYGLAAASGSTNPGAIGKAEISTDLKPKTTPGPQDLIVGAAGLNDTRREEEGTAQNPFAPFDAFQWQVQEIGWGDRPIGVLPNTVEAEAGVELVNTVICEFQDGDAAGKAADYTVTVNWGDGTAANLSTGSNPKVSIAGSPKTPGKLAVLGTHTYAQPGTYLVEVILDSAMGASAVVRQRAVVFAPGQTLRPIGQVLSIKGAKIKNQLIATFTDNTPGVQAGNYKATIDWGDGGRNEGRVKMMANGKFGVYGTYKYKDSDSFAVAVHLRRIGIDPGTAMAWSTIRPAFNTARRLPPFSFPHLAPVVNISTRKDIRNAEDLLNLETSIDAAIRVTNSGDKLNKASKFRFWLSKDKNLDKTGPNADLPVKMGTMAFAPLPRIAPGRSVEYAITNYGPRMDYRLKLPRGHTGAGHYIIAEVEYRDPLADHLPIDRIAVSSRINGIEVSKASLFLTEISTGAGARNSDKFTVRLDSLPTADVVIKLTSSDTGRAQVSPTTLTFTPSNATIPQEVTVTAVDDAYKNPNNSVTITLAEAESEDPVWNGLDPADVRVSVLDNDTTPPPDDEEEEDEEGDGGDGGDGGDDEEHGGDEGDGEEEGGNDEGGEEEGDPTP